MVAKESVAIALTAELLFTNICSAFPYMFRREKRLSVKPFTRYLR